MDGSDKTEQKGQKKIHNVDSLRNLALSKLRLEASNKNFDMKKVYESKCFGCTKYVNPFTRHTCSKTNMYCGDCGQKRLKEMIHAKSNATVVKDKERNGTETKGSSSSDNGLSNSGSTCVAKIRKFPADSVSYEVAPKRAHSICTEDEEKEAKSKDDENY